MARKKVYTIRKCTAPFIAAVYFIITVGRAQAIGPGYSINNGVVHINSVAIDSPMIIDNDWQSDSLDTLFMVAQSNMGRANLRGIIATRDMWNCDKGICLFSLDTQIKDFNDGINAARQSGLSAPDVTRGAQMPLVQPEDGVIEHTRFTPSDGSKLIIREARKASRSKPLLIALGGCATTLATAYLTDNSIANKVIVVQSSLGYNKDPWAQFIVTSRFRSLFADYPSEPTTDVSAMKNRIQSELPDTPLRSYILNTVAVNQFGNVVGDGPFWIYLYRRRTWSDMEKVNLTGVFSYISTCCAPYDALRLTGYDFFGQEDKWFSVMAEVLKAKKR